MAPRTVPEGSPLSLDRIVHGPLRLGIVAALATAERRTFTELRDALGATDGNLNASLQKLEQAGYVAASKKAEGRVAVTEYQLTRAGQKALAAYLEQLERIVAPVRKRLERSEAARRRARLSFRPGTSRRPPRGPGPRAASFSRCARRFSRAVSRSSGPTSG